MFFRLILLFQMAVIAILCGCGGGSDVGNPDICGHILAADGAPLSKCKVMLGPRACDPGKVEIGAGVGELKITLYDKPFDSIYTSIDGSFIFDNVEPGAYIISVDQDNLMGISQKIDHSKDFDTYVEDIKITFPSKLSIVSYSSTMDTNAKAFITARIDGTRFASLGLKSHLFFDKVPKGLYDIILYRKDKSVEYIKDFDVISNDSMTIQVNPDTPPDQWTYRKKQKARYPRPYIDRYNFESIPISSPYSFKHYCWIQFSHDMETRITDNAIKVFSNDNLTEVNKVVQWQGSNQVLINLCTNGTATCADDTSSLKKGITYSIVIDTTAISIDGYTLAWPDTLKLTP